MVLAAVRAAKITPEQFLAFTAGSTSALAWPMATPRPPPPGNGNVGKDHNFPRKPTESTTDTNILRHIVEHNLATASAMRRVF